MVDKRSYVPNSCSAFVPDLFGQYRWTWISSRWMFKAGKTWPLAGQLALISRVGICSGPQKIGPAVSKYPHIPCSFINLPVSVTDIHGPKALILEFYCCPCDFAYNCVSPRPRHSLEGEASVSFYKQLFLPQSHRDFISLDSQTCSLSPVR